MTTATRTHISLTPFLNWLAAGERGLSSEAIMYHLTGTPVPPPWGPGLHHPSDPADFRRCQLLLTAVPLAQVMFTQMRTASPQWARLVDAWDEIHATIESEVPDYLHTRDWSASAMKGYRLMKRVIAGGTLCETCDGTGSGTDCVKCKGKGKRGGGRCRACYGRGATYCPTCRGNGYTGGDR